MILIGQYDSPFVRRVAIALALYGLDYEHRPWSTFGDGEKIARYNPLMRVPTLVLHEGEALVESAAILDALDDLVGPERALIAAAGPERRRALRVAALACGAGDKAVSLLYERVLRAEQLALWAERCGKQITGVLALLERELAEQSDSTWFGADLGHADIAVAVVLRFIGEAHPALLAGLELPNLKALAARCEALEPFRRIQQPLAVPGGR